MGSENVQIRPAKKEDMVAVARLIQELADFQNMPNGPKLNAKGLYSSVPLPLLNDKWNHGYEQPKVAGTPYLIHFEALGRAVLKRDKPQKHFPFYSNQYQRDGFEINPPSFRLLVAEEKNDLDGDGIVGYALYFTTYSTWLGVSMMLEDLYVKPTQRRHGIGKRLFNAVVKEASLARSCRLDFHVLEWNKARSFYESAGAVNLTKTEQWCLYRLDGEAFQKLVFQN